MSFQDSLRKNLTPELYQQVLDALGDDFNFDVVPRTRLNAVIRQRNELQEQLAGVPQPPATPAAGKPEGEPLPDIESMKQALEAQYSQKAAEQVEAVKIQYAALAKLRDAGVIDPELVWSSNVFDKTKLSMNGDTLVGFDDMLAQLAKDRPHLIRAKEPDVPTGTGKDGESTPPGVTTREDFLKLSADQQLAFKQAHPTVFQRFMSQI